MLTVAAVNAFQHWHSYLDQLSGNLILLYKNSMKKGERARTLKTFLYILVCCLLSSFIFSNTEDDPKQ